MATRLWSVVFDAADPHALGHWWSNALGWPVGDDEPDEVNIGSAIAGVPTLVFVPVDDPKVVKNRVHVDLSSTSAADQAATVERLLAAGATRADVGQRDVPWVVLHDPEGNEFCVLEPRESYRDAPGLAAIVVDVDDPMALAEFWTAASGWQPTVRERDHVALRRPGGAPPDLDLLRVGEPKIAKNRVHLDVAPWTSDDRDAEVARLEALGGKEIDVGQGPDVTWRVLADPEGNEFCVLRPR
jgi:predicted enzyme related to lactoylglutathione lyase